MSVEGKGKSFAPKRTDTSHTATDVTGGAAVAKTMRFCSTCKFKVVPTAVPATGAAAAKNDAHLYCPRCETHVGWVPKPTAEAKERKLPAVVPLDTSRENFERICTTPEYADLINDDPVLKGIVATLDSNGIDALKPWQIKAVCKAFGPPCPCGRGGPLQSRCKTGTGNYFWCCRRGPDACAVKIWQQSSRLQA